MCVRCFSWTETTKKTFPNQWKIGRKQSQKTVQLNSLVESREAGLDGLIGDETCQISGGEKARLALARAMLSSAPILLIDEILASLDPRTSYEIEKLILSIENKLVVHISHKSSDELKSQYDAILDFSQFI